MEMEEDTSSTSCFKSSVNIAAATLASSYAIFFAYINASFALSLYMHASLFLLVLSKFWCSSTNLMELDRNCSRLRALEISV